MDKIKKKAVVVHSGGMDSSLCLGIAAAEFGAAHVLSISFIYNQRHQVEVEKARKISNYFHVDHMELEINCLSQITMSALTNRHLSIEHGQGSAPNTLVVGRNGLMARLAGIHADSLGAGCIYLGIMQLEGANSGYRDCSRSYMDLIQEALRIDFNNALFEIRTPLVLMTKKESMELGYRLGILEYLLEETVTCYEGIEKIGCSKCPACRLRNQGLKLFCLENPEFQFSYRDEILNFCLN